MIEPSIIVPSSPKYLRLIRTFVAAITQMSGLSEGSIDEVILAVDEACTNVIRHAYNNDFKKEIIVRFIDSNDRFEVIIEDSGKPAHLDCFKPVSPEGRRGGYGLHLIRRAFDELTYNETDRNKLTLMRYKKGDEINNR